MSTPYSKDIGARLGQERRRLKLTQQDFAEAAGVSKTTQHNYESGERVPDAIYLMEAFKLGVSVNYVLRGEVDEAAPLTPPDQAWHDIQALIALWIDMEAGSRRIVMELAIKLAAIDRAYDAVRTVQSLATGMQMP